MNYQRFPKLKDINLKVKKVVTLGVGHQLFEQAQVIASEYDCQMMSEYEGTSLDAVRHMVAINMGLSFFSRLYAASEI
jgi:LysR family hydrogen peroxide-inducible transcriptional activator